LPSCLPPTYAGCLPSSSAPESTSDFLRRQKLLEADSGKLFDKIGRAFGILQNSHLLSSNEAMNLLSLIRLGVDLGVFSEGYRSVIDRLFIEAQPGHLQHAQKAPCEPGQRDLLRAARLRSEFANLTRPVFTVGGDGKN
jgi:protein arginine kinase